MAFSVESDEDDPSSQNHASTHHLVGFSDAPQPSEDPEQGQDQWLPVPQLSMRELMADPGISTGFTTWKSCTAAVLLGGLIAVGIVTQAATGWASGTMFVTGMASTSGSEDDQWTGRFSGLTAAVSDEVSTATAPSTSMTTTSFVRVPDSLFCFMLIVPWTGELQLAGLQVAIQAGIFACDGHAVYSDRVIHIGDAQHNVTSIKLKNTDLNCGIDPWSHTAMNTHIFRNLWRQMMDEGRWKEHDWIAKVDADSVFLPGRLRYMLHDPYYVRETKQQKGVWLNNCDKGLHGPIEIMSKNAIEFFSGSWWWCSQQWTQEDVWLRHCMWQIGIPQVNVWALLAEAHCHSWDWYTCQNGEKVVFHPFKDPQAWHACHDRALAGFTENGVKVV